MTTSRKQIGLASLVILAINLAPVTARAQMMVQGRRMMPITMFQGTPSQAARPTPVNQGVTGQVSATSSAFAPVAPSFGFPANLGANPGATAFGNANAINVSAGLTNPYAASAANPYANVSAGYGGNSTSASSQNPYGGSGYGSSYYESTLGGYLRGTADIVASQGKWLGSVQQASLLREQNQQATIETRRKSFDETRYERANTPTFEQERDRVARDDLKRSLNDPPASEIWSGQALNTLLADLAKRPPDEAGAQAPPLDEDMLRHINLSPGKGSVGLIRNEGRLSWPLALRSHSHQRERESLNSLVPTVINQAINGRVDPGTLKEIADSVRRLQERLTGDIRELSAAQYIEARRFLIDLEVAQKALARPDAGDYFTRKYAAQGRTIAELVKYMTSQGLTFAPAVPGDNAAYMAVHRAMADYHLAAKARLAAEH
jgi:hypothetical protein